MKIVLDTNVLLSYYLFQGYTAEVVDHVLLFHETIISDWIYAEFQEKCKTKFKIQKNDLSDILSHIRRGIQILIPNNPLPTSCSDKDDNHILRIAEFSKSKMILTGDKDLLVMNPYKSIEILSPREFKLRFLV